MRIALGIEYDGRPYCGWQSQPSGCGVQDALEQAVAAIAGHPARVVAAGRTDTGVHALAQVVHFDTHASRPINAWVRGVNTHLPPSIRVAWATETGDEFHARFSASGRRYRYLLLDAPVAPAIDHGRVGWFHQRLDHDLMAQACGHLLGCHDFSSFRAAECQAHSPVKTIHRAKLYRSGPLVVLDIAADAFLHHMVRNIVGSLVYVGKGSLRPDDLRQLLAQRDRRNAPPTFAPDGLYLSGVRYPPAFILPGFEARTLAGTGIDYDQEMN